MAIINTNTAINSLGDSLASTYIRVISKDIYDGSVDVILYVYKDKASFQANSLPIQDFLDLDFRHFNTGQIADTSRANIHNLVVAELVSRGFDGAKLTIDLV